MLLFLFKVVLPAAETDPTMLSIQEPRTKLSTCICPYIYFSVIRILKLTLAHKAKIAVFFLY